MLITPKIFKYLPVLLRSRIEHRLGLVKILDNIGWLFVDKVLRMGVGLLVGVWVARYLGPEKFGILNFAMAFVGLFGTISTLGLQGIMVRDIVKNPEESNVILGTGFVLRVLAGIFVFGLVIGVISYLRPEDNLTKTIVAILGVVQIFHASQVIKYWFESQVQSKFIVWTENLVFLFIAGFKVSMILIQAPLIAFAWIIFLESVLVSIFSFVVYRIKTGDLFSWKPSFVKSKRLLKDSWPLILSGLAIAIYMKIDQIMIGQIIGDEEVGIYSAAVRISEIWYFIPMVITASVFPAIIEAKKKSEALYYERLQKLYNLLVWMAIAVALPMTFLSHWVIKFLFGQAYAQAGTVLSIHIWTAVFVFLGVACSNWFLIENRQILSLQRTLLGAVVNVGLNLILIPNFGIIGAAYATVVSRIICDLLYDFIQKETRPMFWMKIRSFNIQNVLQLIK